MQGAPPPSNPVANNILTTEDIPSLVQQVLRALPEDRHPPQSIPPPPDQAPVPSWIAEVTADDVDRDLSSSPILRYEDWLPEWTKLTTTAPTRPCIPTTACIISTPLVVLHWDHALATYPNRDLADLFLQGISPGFRIGFSYGSTHLKPSKLNLEGARSHPNVVDDYLQTEINLNRVTGPFPSSLLLSCQISRF